MSSGIRRKKNFVDWPYDSKVISKIKVKLWTGGGARGNDLETPKLVYLMLGESSIRMSNQNNFPAIGSMGCHRRPVGRRIIIIIIRTGTNTIGASAPSVLGPGNGCLQLYLLLLFFFRHGSLWQPIEPIAGKL